MDVSTVRWPAEADRREDLARRRAPRLLLIDVDDPPPPSCDCLEDWVRVPAPEEEVRARLDALRARALAHGGEQPELDEAGILRRGSRWVELPPLEARLLGALLERFGAVVGRTGLQRAGWPADAPARRNVLDVHILRLRRRIAPLGLRIKTIRSRGYLLEHEPSNNGNGAAATPDIPVSSG